MKLIIHTDGSSRGNPGPAVSCWCIGSSEIINKKELGIHSNNYAELAAVGCGLKAVLSIPLEEQMSDIDVEVRIDSQTVYFWLGGTTPSKNVKEREKIKEMIKRIKDIEKSFKSINYITVRRENNKADPGYI